MDRNEEMKTLAALSSDKGEGKDQTKDRENFDPQYNVLDSYLKTNPCLQKN
jgi:hypothetical protein